MADSSRPTAAYTCHQLGNKATRTIPKELGDFKIFGRGVARRIQSGQAMTKMINAIGRLGPNAA